MRTVQGILHGQESVPKQHISSVSGLVSVPVANCGMQLAGCCSNISALSQGASRLLTASFMPCVGPAACLEQEEEQLAGPNNMLATIELGCPSQQTVSLVQQHDWRLA